MDATDSFFQNLRQKLDVLGFTQVLPIAAVPLVGALFEDLVKTTESLRDSKQLIAELLEEKSCWELGVEPYKCDNARLLAECNRLHLQQIKDLDDFSLRTLELQKKIDNLQVDRKHLQDQCLKLQYQLKTFALPPSDQSTKNPILRPSKKPFVSTVRGNDVALPSNVSSKGGAIRCTKCGVCTKVKTNTTDLLSGEPAIAKVEGFEASLKNLQDEIAYFNNKVESRDREIERLNNLLIGGRPVEAIARDCCYKNIESLTADINILQQDKSQNMARMQEYQNRMHEAMRRALELETKNQQVQQELDELKIVALKVEKEANEEIEQQSRKLDILTKRLESLGGHKKADHSKDSHKMKNKDHWNEIIQKDSEMSDTNAGLKKTINRLTKEISTLRKKLDDNLNQKNSAPSKDSLKSERDFFQKEYLRLLEKLGLTKEMEQLKSELNSKDQELDEMRMKLHCATSGSSPTPDAISNKDTYQRIQENVASTYTSDCVQASMLRADRERDCLKRELGYICAERDSLREQLDRVSKIRADETRNAEEKIAKLNEQIEHLERDKRSFFSVIEPTERELIISKGRNHENNKRVIELQEENLHLKTKISQLKISLEQTELAMVSYQSKLAFAERALSSSDMQLTTLERTKQNVESEILKLRTENKTLNRTYSTIENEKDKLLAQLDNKTEKVNLLEDEIKSSKKKNSTLEREINGLQETIKRINHKLEHSSDPHKTASICKTLEMQIVALKTSRAEAIDENRRIVNQMTTVQADAAMLKKEIRHYQMEIEDLKQQLKQYVHEVEKAQELLSYKEKERDEMLEHYKSLSHDAVLLEGNNQSLESEAVEYRRRVLELESEINILKKSAEKQSDYVEKLEDKVSTLTSQTTSLEQEVDCMTDECRILKMDLKALKELCDKLETENGKLNEELKELTVTRQKLEYDNKKLLSQIRRNDNTTSNSAPQLVAELLTSTQNELKDRMQSDSELSMEIQRLRQNNDVLLETLAEERKKSGQHERIVNEYQIQNQELRHNITDELYRQSRLAEDRPHASRNTN